MKNILKQKPTDQLNARLKFSLKFVKDSDINNKKILDIGCGFGWFEYNVLKKQVKEISGIEISKEDLKAAKEINDKRLTLKVGGALKIPFNDNYFDTVVAWEVIEHIPKKTEGKMFKEISRVLKKNGVFYLSTPYDSLLSKYLDPAWWLIGHRHYSKKRLKEFGENYGFNVKEIYTKGGFWNLVNLLDMYFSKWIFRRAAFFDKEINEKVDVEYKGNRSGFMGIFVKYEKKS
jgi:ubiquinone/menaquinone biosynthesis C-methylase UbiE